MNRHRFYARIFLAATLWATLAGCAPEFQREASPPIAVHEAPQTEPVVLAPR